MQNGRRRDARSPPLIFHFALHVLHFSFPALKPAQQCAQRLWRPPMHLLALADSLPVPLAVFHLVFSPVVPVPLWRLTAWQRKYEGLESKLHEATTRLIEERFVATTSLVDRHVQAFVVAIDEMKQRMIFGDADVRALGERDQRIELTLATRLDLLKDYIRETAATKKDLERHEAGAERRLCVIEQRLSELATVVAGLKGQEK